MEVPKLLYKKKFLLESVAFVSLFSVLFMVVYQPFSVTTWFGFGSWRTFAITAMFYAIAVSTLFVSKFILIDYQKKYRCSAKTFIVWSLAEFLTIAIEYWALTQTFGMSSTHTTFRLVVKILFCVAFLGFGKDPDFSTA